MADEKDSIEDKGVTVTMRPAPEGPVDEWQNEFADGHGAATTIDPDALKKLRLVDSSPDMSAFVVAESETEAPVETPKSSTAFEALGGDARAEFDDHEMTVMESRSVPEREEDALSPGNQPCPKCGVMVAVGYPKCPRCKAVLVEGAQAHRKTAGGTSVIGRTVPWTIVLIAAVLTGIIYYLAERDPRVEGLDNDESGESRTKGDPDLPGASVPADDTAADNELDEAEDREVVEDGEEEDPGDAL